MPAPEPLAPPRRAHLVAAARAALASMAGELGALLPQELGRLAAARAAWRSGGGAGALASVAHDLHGLGATYGAPLAGRIAASLGRVLAAQRAPRALVDAHVDAIGAVVREGAAGACDVRGLALAEALEAAAARFA